MTKIEKSEATPRREAIASVNSRPLDEKLAEIAASIPPEALAKLPVDLCDQIDHYVYGTPKR